MHNWKVLIAVSLWVFFVDSPIKRSQTDILRDLRQKNRKSGFHEEKHRFSQRHWLFASLINVIERFVWRFSPTGFHCCYANPCSSSQAF